MTDPITRLTAALEGRYHIEREIGSGGMATVYLAEDLKHDRKVALKVLKPELAAVVGAERFLAEIKTTANLQHPHILPLFDSGEADGFLFYVMPYVDGESLRERLDREGELPVEEAVSIATAVASALDYAHRQGVIHRDIKPANILLHDAQPVVADFGIALAVNAAGRGRLTETGLSLGTPFYMSPEQATGERDPGPRSDVYSLGCVLYEMLVGEPPHTGASAQAVLSKVLTTDPARPSEHRNTIPEYVDAAVLMALARLPADRWATAGGFGDAIGSSKGAGWHHAVGKQAPRRTLRRERTLLTIGITGLLAFAAAFMMWMNPRKPNTGAVLRYRVALPLADMRRQEPRFALSPDGRQVAIVVSGEAGASHIELRSRDELVSRPVAGTEGAIGVFFSPDGTRLGFIADDPLQPVPSPGGGRDPRNALKVVRPGDLPTTIASLGGGIYGGIGGVWGQDDWIYVAGPDLKVVRRYRSDGAAHEDVTTLDTLGGEYFHAWPQLLPDGRGVLFTVRMQSREYRIGVADFGGHHRLLGLGIQARLTPDGHLLIVAADGTLSGYPFDMDELAITGAAVPVSEGLKIGSLATVNLVMAANGTLAYELVDSAATAELVWVTRSGAFESLTPPVSGVFLDLALSPDGERVALTEVRQGRPDVWVRQLEGGFVQRLTTTGASVPRWLADGSSVSYRDPTGGPETGVALSTLFIQKADRSLPAQPVFSGRERFADGSWSVGDWFARERVDNIIVGRLGADSSQIEVEATQATECAPVFSPDGRWIAYVSDELGQPDVYVRPFPNVKEGHFQIPLSGGVEPVWNPAGEALYYIDLDGAMWVAEVAREPAFEVTSRRRLFETRPWRLQSVCETNYGVSPKDGRFLMLRATDQVPEARVIFVEGFSQELKDRRMR